MNFAFLFRPLHAPSAQATLSKRVLPWISILALYLFQIAPAQAEVPLNAPDWSLHAERGNIKIYTRKQPNSDFEAFKAVAVLNANINNIMAVMSNPHSCMEWVHGCTLAEGFDEISFNKRFAYSVNHLPWPVKDRDYVLEINTSNDPKSGDIFMDMYAVADKRPEQPDLVRVNIAETHYIFHATADGKTEMTWLQHTDPGGAIPSWLVNALVVDIPVQSMQALEKLANTDKYSHSVIVYDANGKIIGVKPR